MFRRSASLAIPHRKSLAAIPSLSLKSLGTQIAASNCHTNRSVKLPSFRHFQEEFLTTNKEKWGKKNGRVSQGLCFGRFARRWHRTIRIRIRIAAASHDTMPLSSSCESFFPLQLSKTPRTPNLSKRLFLGVPVGGPKICEKYVKIEKKNGNFQTNFDELTGTPQKQSLGQILDKFEVRGVFESCKGKKVSQVSSPKSISVIAINYPWGRLDYISHSKTNKIVSVSEILG